MPNTKPDRGALLLYVAAVVLSLVVLCVLLWQRAARNRRPAYRALEPAIENYGGNVQVSMGTAVALQYDGPDVRLQGVYQRVQGVRFTRADRHGHGIAEPNGRWAHEVWAHSKGGIAIHDHEIINGLHVWSVGPWSPARGGAHQMGRYAYLYAHPGGSRRKTASRY